MLKLKYQCKAAVPILKNDKINEYMAWSDGTQGLFFVTDCSLAINGKKMTYVLGMLKKHADLSFMHDL